MLILRHFFLTFAIALCAIPAMAQPQPYDGSQDLRPAFMDMVYEIKGGPYDGKRGFLFRISNHETVAVELSLDSKNFDQPIETLLGVGARYEKSVFAFDANKVPYEELFANGSEILNPEPGGTRANRPANFVVIVDTSVDTVDFTLAGRTARGSYSHATVTPLILGAANAANVIASFQIEDQPFSTFKANVISLAPNVSFSSRVLLDGVPIGAIPDTGILELSLDHGTYNLAGVTTEIVGGSTQFTVSGDGPENINVIMTGEGLGSIVIGQLLVNGEVDPVISMSANQFEFAFIDSSGQPYQIGGHFIVTAFRIQLDNVTGGPPVRIGPTIDLTSEFMFDQSGRLVAANPGGVLAILDSEGPGPFELVVSANDLSTYLPLEDSAIVRFEQLD